MTASSLTLLGLKTARKSKCINDKQSSDRHRDCLVLVLSFLRQFGYIQTAAQLQCEGGTILTRYQPADNIDLLQILTEYEDFYELKFKRRPKLSRPLQSSKSDHLHNNGQIVTTSSECTQRRKSSYDHHNHSRGSNTHADAIPKLLPNGQTLLSPSAIESSKHGIAHVGNIDESCGDGDVGKGIILHAQGLKSTKSSASHQPDQKLQSKDDSIVQRSLEERVIKPLPSFGDNIELRSLASTIQSEILDTSPKVSWDDVVGLDDAKRLLKEAVILPIQYPDLFSGLLVPWRGILLFGPPGTGKTMLAKAVATESQTTFFNISASSIVSKFRGESEKLIKVLFDLARYHAPSTVFIDEIDSIMGQRGLCGSNGGEGNEHEGSRRMKTELLIEMDGLGKESQHIFVLAASNMPWDLDQALLRRLEKRIVVPIPNHAARKMLIKNYFSMHYCKLEEEDFDRYAGETKGYNGADMKVLCKEVAMSKIRGVFKKLESMSDTYPHGSPKSPDVQAMLRRDPITTDDLQKGLKSTKPSTDQKLLQRYNEWSDLHGAV